ncbi:FCD domain-containing protein [Curvibacter sp. APW13]|uniref:FCD domain-containing protein n=1 Tax=Curvibacter sp. APW13 TaxID=3077236 RepID=UPI0028DFF247|nr:FCD domain-containing protein [Curvibacter sp. APW13]MDT8989893.1 FCD domain-containing protein [Curvibacter sp. APW13]
MNFVVIAMNETVEIDRAEALELLRTTPVTRLIADSIEDMVVRGDLLPGERLNEVELARKFGVSRGPLREAIRLLEMGGLFKLERNRGTFVRKIALSEAAQLYDLRAGLDATAGRLLCGSISKKQLATLRSLTNQMRRVKESDVEAFHSLNLRFHDELVFFAGNQALTDTYRKVAKQLALFRKRNLYAPSAIINFAKEHAQIVDLIEKGDAEACANALFAHAHGGRQRMIKDGELAGVSDDQ